MALVQVPGPAQWPSVPESLRAYIAEANEQIAQFLDDTRAATTIAFVPSDFGAAAGALAHIRECHLAPGPRFVEWGSGYSVVAGIAHSMGFDSHAIEIDPVLVKAGRALASKWRLEPCIVEGSFIPVGGDDLADLTGDQAWLAVGGPDGYEALGLEADDFDVIYAYPWPGEEEVVFRMFDRYAAAGALLVTYHGRDGVRMNRKSPARRGNRRR